jgi:hypothetical protein
LPAAAAADGEAGAALDGFKAVSPAPPPHPDSAAASTAHRSHLEEFVETIRLHPAQVLDALRQLRLRMLSRIIRICND